ncbi:DUF3696 domain-containing protein [Phnomibacter sp. MR]|uniref:DUF3696 domain-containing protein n=1 Tax=Phnomibacter sp. MR TaxID=3042318 RepID=UPI003A7FF479
MKAHIQRLGVENFRLFKNEINFEFAPITILVGANSSGKSSLIKALDILSGIRLNPISLSKKWENPNDENLQINQQTSTCFSPSILEDIMVLDLTASARSKGDFTNHLSRNSNGKEISFNLNGFNAALNVDTEILLTYVGDKKGRGFQNAVLNRMWLTPKGQKQAIFKVTRKNDYYKFEIDWHFFYDAYRTKLELAIHELTKFQTSVSLKEKKNLVYRVKEAHLRFDLGYALLDSGSDGYVMFDKSGSFLNIGWNFIEKFKLNRDIEAIETLIEQSNLQVNLIELLKEADSPEEIVKLLAEHLVPQLEDAMLNLKYLTFYTEFKKGKFSLFNNMNKFEFVPSKVETGRNAKSNLFTSYLNTFGLSVSFANSNNGRAGQDFFNRFILSSVADTIFNSLSQFQSLNVLTTNRYYPFRTIGIDVVDKITNLTEKFVNIYLTSSSESQEKILKTLSSLMSKKYFSIADEIDIRISDDSRDSVSIMVRKGDMWFNIADQGFGISSLFSVAMAIAMSDSSISGLLNKESDHGDEPYMKTTYPCTIAIEEPEMNLHPKAASALADAFVGAAAYFNTQFIIETHSEYLIRKLQYLTAKKEIKPADTVIYYFYPPDHPDVVSGREPQVKKINIRNDGSLTGEFGSGFFDEADNIALELFLLKKSQEN